MLACAFQWIKCVALTFGDSCNYWPGLDELRACFPAPAFNSCLSRTRIP